mmetsp:Transcript_28337/g.28629  ORF Transcript_28337/g.28629 Transcript_28337/m.28629 type:complete len:608 (+) Transcript_28337:220-2043(+)
MIQQQSQQSQQSPPKPPDFQQQPLMSGILQKISSISSSQWNSFTSKSDMVITNKWNSFSSVKSKESDGGSLDFLSEYEIFTEVDATGFDSDDNAKNPSKSRRKLRSNPSTNSFKGMKNEKIESIIIHKSSEEEKGDEEENDVSIRQSEKDTQVNTKSNQNIPPFYNSHPQSVSETSSMKNHIDKRNNGIPLPLLPSSEMVQVEGEGGVKAEILTQNRQSKVSPHISLSPSHSASDSSGPSLSSMVTPKNIPLRMKIIQTGNEFHLSPVSEIDMLSLLEMSKSNELQNISIQVTPGITRVSPILSSPEPNTETSQKSTSSSVGNPKHIYKTACDTYRVQVGKGSRKERNGKFSRNARSETDALWLCELALIINDCPPTLDDITRTGNYKYILSKGIINSSQEFAVKLLQQAELMLHRGLLREEESQRAIISLRAVLPPSILSCLSLAPVMDPMSYLRSVPVMNGAPASASASAAAAAVAGSGLGLGVTGATRAGVTALPGYPHAPYSTPLISSMSSNAHIPSSSSSSSSASTPSYSRLYTQPPAASNSSLSNGYNPQMMINMPMPQNKAYVMENKNGSDNSKRQKVCSSNDTNNKNMNNTVSKSQKHL